MATIDLKEFKSSVKKVNGKRVHKATNSYGTIDAYAYYNKTKPDDKKYKLNIKQYRKIIRLINNELRELLIDGKDILFPCYMGKLSLRKVEANIKLVDGKVVTNLPIDWNRTLELWHSDEDCYNNKVLIRQENKHTFKVNYDKSKARYNNKVFYQFSINRLIKLGLKNNIKLNKLDAFKYGK